MSLIHEALEKVEQGKKDSPLSPTVILETQEKARARENPPVIYGIVVALVFCLIAGMIYLFVEPRPTEKFVKTPTSGLPRSWEGRFVLTGITRGGTEGTAIINNELVRVGDGVSGARVVSIEEGEVTLDERGETITLEL